MLQAKGVKKEWLWLFLRVYHVLGLFRARAVLLFWCHEILDAWWLKPCGWMVPASRSILQSAKVSSMICSSALFWRTCQLTCRSFAPWPGISCLVWRTYVDSTGICRHMVYIYIYLDCRIVGLCRKYYQFQVPESHGRRAELRGT